MRTVLKYNKVSQRHEHMTTIGPFSFNAEFRRSL